MLKRCFRIICGFIAARLVANIIVFASHSTQKISVIYRDIKLSTDGVEFTPLDADGNVVEPFVYNGTTYLPVRAVGEALGRDVSWDNDTSTVIISGKPLREISLTTQAPSYMNTTRFEMYSSENHTQLRYTPSVTSSDASGWYDFSDRIEYDLNGKAEKFTGTFLPPTITIKSVYANINAKLIVRNENKEILFESETIKKSDSGVPFEIDVTGCEKLIIEFSGATTAKTRGTPSNDEPIGDIANAYVFIDNPVIHTLDY